jgi:hypothetical protein
VALEQTHDGRSSGVGHEPLRAAIRDGENGEQHKSMLLGSG